MVRRQVSSGISDVELFFEITTIHGLYDWFFAKDRKSRVIWMTIILLCCGLLGYSCLIMLADFKSTPPATTIRTKRIDFFPPVLYCPGGVVSTKTKLQSLNTTADDIVFLNDFFLEANTILYKINEKSHKSEAEWEVFRAKLLKGEHTPIHILKNLSGDVQFDSLTFGENGLDTQNRVKPSVVVNIFGICYKFNFSNIAYARQGHFTTYIEINFPSFASEMPSELADYYGYGMLFFGNEVDSFNPIMPAYVHDGRKNFIVMKQTEMHFSNLPKKPCSRADYSLAGSHIFDCYADYLLTKKGCNVLKNVSTSQNNICHLMLHKVYDLPLQRSCLPSTSILDEKLPCTVVWFETTVNPVPLPRPGRTVINLQYQQAILLILEQHEPYTIEVFLSNVGGLISLLCGASMISIVQLAYFLAIFSIRRIRKTTNKNGNTKATLWQMNLDD